MYYISQMYKCPKCGHEQKWSPSDFTTLPVTEDGAPFCPKCFRAFLAEHVGVMEHVRLQPKTEYGKTEAQWAAEGYRILKQGEEILEGDEFWEGFRNGWKPARFGVGQKVGPSLGFRRKLIIGSTTPSFGDLDVIGSGGTAPSEKDPELGGDS